MKAGSKAGLHSHPDRIVYVVNDAELRLRSSGSDWENKSFKAGDIFWVGAVEHEAENAGTADSHNIVFELK
jgi:quercetin dioxygenase-like cupin family protein